MKPRVAFFDFASCEGCQLQVANLEEDIIGVVDKIDVVSFREVMKEHSDEYDIAFIEGSIQRPIDEKRIKDIRSRAKILIAMGACAVNGGVAKLRNQWPVSESKKEVYGRTNLDKNALFDNFESKAVDEVVDVDFYIRGCPIRKEQVLYYVNRLLTMPPRKNLDLRFEITSREKELDDRTTITYNANKCVLCRRCEVTCNQALGVHAIGVSQKGADAIISTPFDVGFDHNNCIYCGQCLTSCPVGALYERSEVEKVLTLLEDDKNFVVFVLDPIAVTSAINKLPTTDSNIGSLMKKIISALKDIGAKKVVNFTSFIYLSSAAQASFIKENNEMTFTSWCPSAHTYIEKFYPKLSKYIHEETSPSNLMLDTLKERYGSENMKIVMVTPCLAYKGHDEFDAVLTAKEMTRLLKSQDVQLDFFPTVGVTFDCDIGMVEKFITGGCSDYTCSLCIMRAAYLGKFNNLEAALTVGAHEDFVHELVFDSEEGFFNALVIEDISKADKYLSGDVSKYNIIELYPCFRGCLSGGGQYPTVSEEEIDRRRTLLKSYKGEVESPYEFASQMVSAFARVKGGA